MAVFGKPKEGQRDSKKAPVAYVSDEKIDNPTRSYLYLDEGTLKFYNHLTGVTSTVTLS